MEQVREDFIAAAVRAEKAGFDGVELHGAHGYLLGSFMDAGQNRRADRYGTSFENRARLLLEIVDGVRARFGIALELTPIAWASCDHYAQTGSMMPDDWS